ncbi:hypothetical protein LCGC14_2560420, partial [marine sediment metagenome]
AKSESASSVIDLQTRGRKRGFCGVLATQRIAKLNKDAAAECNNVLVGRTVIDLDRKRAANDLGFTTKEQELSLKRLDDGEFFGYGPAISKEDYVRVQVGEINTVHPEPGKSILKSSATPENIKNLLKDVIDLPKEVETELKTKQDYLNKINELKKDLRISKSAQTKPLIKVDEKGLERSFAQGQKEAEIRLNKEIYSLKANYKQMEKKVIDAGKILGQEIKVVTFTHKSNVPSNIKVPYQKPVTQVTPESNQSVSSVSNGELGICAKKIYSFLYNHPERSFSKSHVGAFTGYSHSSGGFSNAISQLNGNDLVTKNNGSLQVKEMNPSIAGEYDFSKEAIMGNLGSCPKKIYQLLLDNPYEEYSKEQLGEITNYRHTSGGFSNALSKLNSLGLIIKDNSHIKLNPELMEIWFVKQEKRIMTKLEAILIIHIVVVSVCLIVAFKELLKSGEESNG